MLVYFEVVGDEALVVVGIIAGLGHPYSQFLFIIQSQKCNRAKFSKEPHRDHKVKNPGTLHLGGTPQVLLKAIEQAIHDHIKHMESLLFGLTTVDVRKLAYEVAEKANVPHPFNQEKNGWC